MWRELISKPSVTVLPWFGGRDLFNSVGMKWVIDGPTPPEHGFWKFSVGTNRVARWVEGQDRVEVWDEYLNKKQPRLTGYLVGDRMSLLWDYIANSPGKKNFRDLLVSSSKKVWFLPDNLPEFTKVVAREWPGNGELVFEREVDPPLIIDEVYDAYISGAEELTVKGVPRDLADIFRVKVAKRKAEAARRAEIEAKRRAAAERAELDKKVGTSEGRRALAAVDFDAAARSALVVGGAEFLAARPGPNPGTMTVVYRCEGHRLGCVVDMMLRVVNAGICLTDHYTDESGDEYFTLESLPSVVREAVRDRKLVIWNRGT